jgi:hypothetical protein
MTGRTAAAAEIPMEPTLTPEEQSKDRFFKQLAELSTTMIEAHGRDFAMGALVLAARFIAENKPFTRTAPPAN